MKKELTKQRNEYMILLAEHKRTQKELQNRQEEKDRIEEQLEKREKDTEDFWRPFGKVSMNFGRV